MSRHQSINQKKESGELGCCRSLISPLNRFIQIDWNVQTANLLEYLCTCINSCSLPMHSLRMTMVFHKTPPETVLYDSLTHVWMAVKVKFPFCHTNMLPWHQWVLTMAVFVVHVPLDDAFPHFSVGYFQSLAHKHQTCEREESATWT